MRIELWLAAGLAAMAIGPAAEARPGGGGAPGHGSGHGVSPPGSFSNGPGHRAARGGGTQLGTGPVRIDRGHGRHRGRFGRRDFYLYGGGGIAGPLAEVDPYGNGFFTGGGGQIRLRGGRPHFDYDRSYPYEWASAARAREPEWAEEEGRPAAPGTQARARCTFESGVRVCRGW